MKLAAYWRKGCSGSLVAFQPSSQVSGHKSVTALVCLSAFAEAQRDLDRARSRVAEAALALAKCRHKLDQVVDHAFAEQKFSPIEALFCEEEAARKVYKQAAKRLVRSEERWFALRVALATEQEQEQSGPVPRQRLN
jgi:hypothetical protein